MDRNCQRLLSRGESRKGFTLIEMLIVIIILGILAMVIIPQITVSQDDAKISTLKTNLGAIRSAVELYYAQHGNTYPGMNASGGGAAGTNTAFIEQLTLFSNAIGGTSTVANASFPFGPYIKGGALPTNPFTSASNVAANNAQTNISLGRTADTAVGYVAWLPLGIVYGGGNATVAAY